MRKNANRFSIKCEQKMKRKKSTRRCRCRWFHLCRKTTEFGSMFAHQNVDILILFGHLLRLETEFIVSNEVSGNEMNRLNS